MTALTILMLATSYLLGSISSAVIVCRLFNLGDPRAQGSGNPGATNVLRIGGKAPAVLVLIFDILKGTLPVWFSYYLGMPAIILALVAVMACLGHMFPIFFNFTGGKAVATAFGALLPIGLDLATLLIITWVMVLWLTGYSSLAAVITVALAPIFTWFLKPEYAIAVCLLSIIIIWRHKANIIRLFQHQEPKSSFKSRFK